MNFPEIANTLYDNDLRLDQIVWLAGGVHGFTDDDFLEDVIFDAAEGAKHMHETMQVFLDLPEWAQDNDGFPEWSSRSELYGFIVKVLTPKPTEFYDDGSYTTLSFGYSASTYIYVNDVADAVPLAIKWREERFAAWRNEGEAS